MGRALEGGSPVASVRQSFWISTSLVSGRQALASGGFATPYLGVAESHAGRAPTPTREQLVEHHGEQSLRALQQHVGSTLRVVQTQKT